MVLQDTDRADARKSDGGKDRSSSACNMGVGPYTAVILTLD